MMPRQDGGGGMSGNPHGGNDAYAQGFTGRSHPQSQQPQQQQQQPFYPEDMMMHQQQQQRFMAGAQGMQQQRGMDPMMQQQQPPPQQQQPPMYTGGPGAMQGYAAEMSPQVARMTTGGQAPYPQGFYGGMPSNSPKYQGGPPGMEDPMAAAAGGGGGGPGGGTGAGAGGMQPSGGNPDREDELLLQLLIARRQRGRGGPDEGRNNQILADELMRLRQGRRGGSIPGMPPIYDVPPPNMPPDAADRSPRYVDARGQGEFRGKRPQAYTDMSGNIKYHHMPMDGFEAEMPPQKKKRQHKKKPADMPRRPLSAYNLFFSEERERILKEIDDKDGGGEKEEEEKDDSKKDEEKEGEDDSKKEEGEESKKKEEGEDSSDVSAKPQALMRSLIPAEKKRRPHRKTHGKISFQQLARMVGERWKSLPDDKRKKYQGLAQEDMKRQKVAMEAYYAKQNKQTTAEGASQRKEIADC